jgi:hypothetical protein
MNRELIHRISYYTRKVAEKSSVNLADKHPKWFTYRNQRLIAYKRLMHNQIKQAGY